MKRPTINRHWQKKSLPSVSLGNWSLKSFAGTGTKRRRIIHCLEIERQQLYFDHELPAVLVMLTAAGCNGANVMKSSEFCPTGANVSKSSKFCSNGTSDRKFSDFCSIKILNVNQNVWIHNYNQLINLIVINFSLHTSLVVSCVSSEIIMRSVCLCNQIVIQSCGEQCFLYDRTIFSLFITTHMIT